MKTKTNLRDLFQTTLLLSGTPDNFQRNIETNFSKDSSLTGKVFKAGCPLYTAVDEKWVCRPTLNLVFPEDSGVNIGGTDTDKALPKAVETILKNEKALTQLDKHHFAQHLLVCCKNIDSISKIKEVLKDRIDAHFISLHTEKRVLSGEEKSEQTLVPEIDDKPVTKDAVMEALANLQTYFGDNKPVVVFQVNMISEGVNISSFNSIFIQTHSDRLAMQQIGRVLRNCKEKDSEGVTHEKKDEGHASVYCMVDTIEQVGVLLTKLEEFELTDKAFNWGRKIDLHIGGKSSASEDELVEEASWKEIDENLKSCFKQAFISRGSFKEKFMANLTSEQRELLDSIWESFFDKDSNPITPETKPEMPEEKVDQSSNKTSEDSPKSALGNPEKEVIEEEEEKEPKVKAQKTEEELALEKEEKEKKAADKEFKANLTAFIKKIGEVESNPRLKRLWNLNKGTFFNNFTFGKINGEDFYKIIEPFIYFN